MASVIKRGGLDLIGAARPSIADPFLPKKIEQGRIETIRECIGCNVCTTGDNTNVPMRCTQNPTVGEEWRRKWHPEIIPPLETPKPYLIVGGGPAGLEAARALAQRGAEVILAEAAEEIGGRVTLESNLPGLAEWSRVRDWRVWQLQQTPNAELYTQSTLSATNVLDYGIANVALATGATWRRDGVGRAHRLPLPFLDNTNVLTPDDLMKNGAAAINSNGPVVIFDDDRFYIASVLAELSVQAGHNVVFVTPAPIVAPWSEYTLEQERIQRRLLDLGVVIKPLSKLGGLTDGKVTLQCVYSSAIEEMECGTLVTVTARLPQDTLWRDLSNNRSQWADAGIHSIVRLGDCLSPGLIAAAVHSGHDFAQSAGSDGASVRLREDVV